MTLFRKTLLSTALAALWFGSCVDAYTSGVRDGREEMGKAAASAMIGLKQQADSAAVCVERYIQLKRTCDIKDGQIPLVDPHPPPFEL